VRLGAFAGKWDTVYPGGRTWDRITPFFAYPAEIRKITYAISIVESLRMSLRRITKMRGSSPNEVAALKWFRLASNMAGYRVIGTYTAKSRFLNCSTPLV
jgi:putative transposase